MTYDRAHPHDRVAELEADVKTWSEISDRNAVRLREAAARIADLEVERDRLKAALNEAQKQQRLFPIEAEPRHQP